MGDVLVTSLTVDRIHNSRLGEEFLTIVTSLNGVISNLGETPFRYRVPINYVSVLGTELAPVETYW